MFSIAFKKYLIHSQNEEISRIHYFWHLNILEREKYIF